MLAMVGPRDIARSLSAARKAWLLSHHQLAVRANIPERDVRVAERSARVDASALAALAGALGGSLDDLLSGREFWAAPAIALKSVSNVIDPADVQSGISRVAPAAREVSALAAHLALPDLWASRGRALGPTGLFGPPVEQAEHLAALVRNKLRIGRWEPLSSIRSTMASLGVATFYTAFATDEIDGAMWQSRGSAPCVAVNARSRRGLLTAFRMTFAHELCHALFDRPKSGDAGRIDTRSQRSSELEQRANAFAAYFLAPRAAVRRFLGDAGISRGNVPTAQHLLALSLHFGVGVEAMAWHLVHCGYWTEDTVAGHSDLRSPHFASIDDRDLRPTDAEALVAVERRGHLLDLATQALAEGKISVARWRELLILPATSDWKLILAERHVAPDSEHYVAQAAA